MTFEHWYLVVLSSLKQWLYWLHCMVTLKQWLYWLHCMVTLEQWLHWLHCMVTHKTFNNWCIKLDYLLKFSLCVMNSKILRLIHMSQIWSMIIGVKPVTASLVYENTAMKSKKSLHWFKFWPFKYIHFIHVASLIKLLYSSDVKDLVSFWFCVKFCSDFLWDLNRAS